MHILRSWGPVAALSITAVLGASAGHADDVQGGACVQVMRADTVPPTAQCIPPGTGKTIWFSDCKGCPDMVVVPTGTVRVTSLPPTEAIENQPGDTEVAIAAPFAVGRFAVTFDEWDTCVADGGCDGYIPADQGWGRGRRPVINVSFDDAQAYAGWLSRKTGAHYRLLTGPEREYVARAGSETAYWWGNELTLNRANADLPVRSDVTPQDNRDGTGNVAYRTVPADSFEPNPWGLYNVHGNVWEWTSDCAAAEELGVIADEPPQDDAAQPSVPAANCGSRVSRGGSWIDFPYLAKSGAFVAFPAGSRNYAQGFRVARDLP